MEFESQICTTKEQSEQLLTLGLRRETADMCLDYMGNVYTYPVTIIELMKNDWSLTPLWSLHRLIELSGMGIIETTTDNIYDKVIAYISYLIKCDSFNKEYLKQ